MIYSIIFTQISFYPETLNLMYYINRDAHPHIMMMMMNMPEISESQVLAKVGLHQHMRKYWKRKGKKRGNIGNNN